MNSNVGFRLDLYCIHSSCLLQFLLSSFHYYWWKWEKNTVVFLFHVAAVFTLYHCTLKWNYWLCLSRHLQLCMNGFTVESQSLNCSLFLLSKEGLLSVEKQLLKLKISVPKLGSCCFKSKGWCYSDYEMLPMYELLQTIQ